MNTFSAKDYMSADIVSFINISEFAEKCMIEGKSMDVVIDNDMLQQRSKTEYDGIIVGELLYYVKKSDFVINGVRSPVVDDTQTFNNKRFTIFDVRDDAGVYEIILKRYTN